jgi:putative lipoic acid-binding regulatory protein
MNEQSKGLQFPDHHPIKAVGRHSGEFKQRMVQCVMDELGTDVAIEISEKLSRDGSFISLTLTVWVESRDQLDHIYQRLHATGLLLFAL